MRRVNSLFTILLALSGFLLLTACTTTYDPGYSSVHYGAGVYGGYGYPYYGRGYNYYGGGHRPYNPNNPNRPNRPDRPSIQPVSRSSASMARPSGARMSSPARMSGGRRR